MTDRGVTPTEGGGSARERQEIATRQRRSAPWTLDTRSQVPNVPFARLVKEMSQSIGDRETSN